MRERLAQIDRASPGPKASWESSMTKTLTLDLAEELGLLTIVRERNTREPFWTARCTATESFLTTRKAYTRGFGTREPSTGKEFT